MKKYLKIGVIIELALIVLIGVWFVIRGTVSNLPRIISFIDFSWAVGGFLGLSGLLLLLDLVFKKLYPLSRTQLLFWGLGLVIVGLIVLLLRLILMGSGQVFWTDWGVGIIAFVVAAAWILVCELVLFKQKAE